MENEKYKLIECNEIKDVNDEPVMVSRYQVDDIEVDIDSLVNDIANKENIDVDDVDYTKIEGKTIITIYSNVDKWFNKNQFSFFLDVLQARGESKLVETTEEHKLHVIVYLPDNKEESFDADGFEAEMKNGKIILKFSRWDGKDFIDLPPIETRSFEQDTTSSDLYIWNCF